MPEFVTIPALLNLHHTDRVLRDTREGLENVPRDQRAAEEHLAKVDADLAKMETEHREVLAQIAAEELEADSSKSGGRRSSRRGGTQFRHLLDRKRCVMLPWLQH